MIDSNVLGTSNNAAVHSAVLSCFERLTPAQADRLHGAFGVIFEMNDGHLTGVSGAGIICGTEFDGEGGGLPPLCPAAL